MLLDQKKFLNSTSIKCSSGKVFVTFTLTEKSLQTDGKFDVKNNDIANSRGSHCVTSPGKTSTRKSDFTTFSAKKKSPSRRRRDRERFRKFLEQKKRRKQTAAQSPQTQSQDSQLSVNSNTIHQPSVTRHRSLSAGHWESRCRSLSVGGYEEAEDIRTSPPAENIHGPFLEQHYNDCACPACVNEPSFDNMAAIFCGTRNCCYWCGTPPCQVAGGLKKCTQCKCVAYCSKGCQLADWNQRHRVECKIKLEAAHKSVSLLWNVRLRHKSHTHRLAAYRSRIRENALLISPHIGMVSVT